jgi:predicted metal-binding membrane protein
MLFERGSDHGFLGLSALLFVASAAVTVVWCASMSAMGQVAMPGGWQLSMVWMRMPGQTWFGVAASFLGMWIAMMVAMMLPSIVPTLRRYRQVVRRAGTRHLGRLTALVALGYFFVWTLFGAVVLPLGVALSAIAMRQPALARAAPIVVGAVVLIAGVFQLTTASSRRLARRRGARENGRSLPSDAGTAWQHGVRLGVHCGQCCAGPMVILLIVGIMDLRVMAVVTAAITAERLAPPRMRVAQAVGAGIVGTGLVLTARAIGLG